MQLNLHALTQSRGVLLATGLLICPLRSPAQTTCPAGADSALEAGWRAYRSNSNSPALEHFRRAFDFCPENLDAAVGLGFTNLRLGRVGRADSIFRSVIERSPASSDAWEGRSRAAFRLADTAGAIAAGRRALALAPDNGELRAMLERLDPEWQRPEQPRATRPATLQVSARTRGRRFEVIADGGWRPFYLRGVNLGVALPGRYPSEFPADSAQYGDWLNLLSAMNANTVRVYTILPPPFYRALRGFNRLHPERPLRLLHGVWAELPPRHDFNAPSWQRDFQDEMRRVVDVIHGAMRVPLRPGHASGRYDADVSPWVLGYIIGREWEPFAVKAFDARNPGGPFVGRYLKAGHAPAMDRWLAQQCDLMLGYEADRYNALRPIAYTNWPTLDPLHHPTEATTAEEAYWRRRSGRRSEAKKLEYENDALGLDANLIAPTAQNPAGWFASYHAYPYYPDFVMLEPGYRAAQSSSGPSSYFGYLRALVEHHGSIPTLIAEYGVPSSRGVAHLHPLGWSHGGHDERSMAAVDVRLTRDIREAGAAGSVLFAWLDEWFKKNWAVIDYEIPADNTRLWHNVMDAEQNYGILGQYAGPALSTPELGGDVSRWRALGRVQTSESSPPSMLRGLSAGADESFLYFAIELSPGKFPWDSLGLQLAIDTYLPRTGQHQLPISLIRSEVGFEFLVDLPSPDSGQVRVLPEYNRHDSRINPKTGDDHGRFFRRPVITRDREDGRFDSLLIITNRARFGRDGRFYPARGYDRGRLRFGTQRSTTLADWFYDEKAGLVELRIPYDLLNVTDPSSRTLLYDKHISGDMGTVTAGDFHFGLVVYRKGRSGQPSAAALPATVQGGWPAGRFQGWRWRGWTEPRSHARLKPVYDSLRQLWQEAPVEAQARSSPTAP